MRLEYKLVDGSRVWPRVRLKPDTRSAVVACD